jgi:multidrug efflux pump
VRTIKSVSREEVSQITIEFVPSATSMRPPTTCATGGARRNLLPEPPTIRSCPKIEADAQAIIWLAFLERRHRSSCPTTPTATSPTG